MPGPDVTGWIPLAAFAAALALTVSRPANGLLFAAMAAPLGLADATIGSLRFGAGDAIVLGFLAGSLLRLRPDRPGPAVVAPVIGYLLAAALVARLGFPGGVRAAEGIALAFATTMVVRRTPAVAVTVPAALAASAAVAVLRRLLAQDGRTAVDAGCFAMIGCLAIGMAIRHGGHRRMLWAGAAGMSGLGVALAAARPAVPGAGGAEPGAIVWGLLVVWIGTGLARTARALWQAPRDARLAGAAAGVAAFLATRLSPAALFAGGSGAAFWIQFGLMAALAGSTLLGRVTSASPATSSRLAPATRTPRRR
jgi:hypothetical protein